MNTRENFIITFLVMLLTSAGCNNQPEPTAETPTLPEESTVTKPDNRVGKAVEGAIPATTDKNEDMARIISKTNQNEIETIAFKKERDQDLTRIEQEKISKIKK